MLKPVLSKKALLKLRALSYPPEQTVSVVIDGRTIGTADVLQVWSEVDMALPEDVAGQGSPVTVELRHSRSLSPFETTDGASSDRRELAAAYDWLCVTAAQADPVDD